MDSRHKRVWKACERCRMKKTKVRTTSSLSATYVESYLTVAYSVMANFPASAVKMMALCVQPALERRWNTNSYLEGKEAFVFRVLTRFPHIGG